MDPAADNKSFAVDVSSHEIVVEMDLAVAASSFADLIRDLVSSLKCIGSEGVI